jgi:hypothetical protein
MIEDAKGAGRSVGTLVTPTRVLMVILVSFTVMSAAVLALTPPWESNDEPDHIHNVEVMASGHWYRITPDSGLESHQAPLYYIVLAGFQKLMRLPVELPDGQVGPVGDNQQHGNFSHKIPQDGTDQRRVDLLRLPSIVFGLLAVVFTFLAARFVSSDSWTPVVAAAVIAGVPRFVFLSGVVNNDNLSDVLGGAAIALAMLLLTRPSTSPRNRVLGAAGMGVLIGALTLTKLTNALVAPGLLLAVLISARSRREGLRCTAVASAVALAVCGWWLVQNQVRYGDPFAIGASDAHFRSVFPALLEVAGPIERIFVQIPQGIYSSFWYVSGWNQFTWHWYWYLPFWLLAAVGIAGLFSWKTRSALATGVLPVLATVVAGAAAIVWVLGIHTSTQQARVAFVGLPAVAILIALGYERLGIHPLWRFLLPAIGVIGTVAAIRYNVVIPYD